MIQLINPIKISSEITSSRIEIPVEYQSTIQNKYEYFNPMDECPIAYGYGKCFENQTNPYVLCCTGESKRGNGQHCMIIDYYNSYDVYKFDSFILIHEIQVTIETKSLKMFNLSNFNTKINYPDFGSVSISISPQYYNIRPFDLRFSYLLFARQVSNEYFILNRFQIEFNKLLLTQNEWKSLAKCTDNINDQTKTHNDINHVNDQLYMFKQNTLEYFFVQNQYGSNVTFNNNKLVMNVNPDLILMTITLENID